jgi:hypothetical protein
LSGKRKQKEELIYKKGWVSRIIHSFFYYWMALTWLLFLLLCVCGTIFSIRELIEVPGTTSNIGNWVLLFIGVGATWLLVFVLIKTIKNMVKATRLIEGLILKKETIEGSEDGTSYYVTLKGKTTERIEIFENSYSKVIQGNHLRILYSNKLDEPLKITKIT